MPNAKNNKQSDLSKFRSTLYAILIESQNHYSDAQNALKQVINTKKNTNSSISSQSIKTESLRKFSNSGITSKVVSASLFSYMHATFEKFMISLIKNTISSNTKFKNAYTNKIASTAERDEFRYLISYLTTPKKRISKLNDVSRSTNGIINLSRDMLSMTGVNTNDDLFESAYRVYIECRETNNILKHRGDLYDKEYVDRVIKLSNQISKKIDKNKLFSHVYSEPRKPCSEKNIIGQKLDITPSIFIRAFSCIIFLAAYFIYHFSNSDDNMKNDINYITHTLMYLCKDIHHGGDIVLLELSMNISSLVEDDSIIAFNHILANIKHMNALKNKVFTEKNIKPDDESKQNIKTFIDKQLCEINKLKFIGANTAKGNKILSEHYKKILELYCLGEKKEMFDYVFYHDIIEKKDFESWALFTEFHNDKMFLDKFKYKFKSKFEPFSSILSF